MVKRFRKLPLKVQMTEFFQLHGIALTMSPADNCLYWHSIFRLMAVQYHCHSLIMADTSLSDTAKVCAHVGGKHVFAFLPACCVCEQTTEMWFVVYIV